MTQNPPSDTSLLLNLTTDDVFTTQMALHYANAVLEAGYPVSLFLNVRAVTLADETIPQHTPALMEETSHDRIRSLLERGATIYACKQCSVQAGVDEDDWLEGIEPGDIDLVEFQMDSKYKSDDVLSDEPLKMMFFATMTDFPSTVVCCTSPHAPLNMNVVWISIALTVSERLLLINVNTRLIGW